MKQTFELAIVDDDLSILDSLSQVFVAEADFGVGRVYSSPALALREIPQYRPALAIIDLWLPRLDGIELTRQLTAQCGGLKVLMYTACADPQIVLQAMNAGALGYVIKPVPTVQLLEAVRTVVSGKPFFPPGVVDLPVQAIQSPALAWHGLPISPQQLEILKRYFQNFTYQQMGDKLHISPRSVDPQMSRIRIKLKAHTRRDLQEKAIHILHPPPGGLPV